MDKVNEESTGLIGAILYDENGNAVAQASINGFTVTLFERESGDVVNSRTAIDLYDSGSWNAVSGMKATVDSDGNCTIRLAADDNQLVSDSDEGEVHVIQITITTTGSLPVTINQEIEYYVQNLTKIT